MCKYCKEEGRVVSQKFIGKFGDVTSIGLTISLNRDAEMDDADIEADLSLYNEKAETAIMALNVQIHFCPFCGEKLTGRVKE